MVQTLRFSRSFLGMLILFLSMTSLVLANAPGKPKEFKVIIEGNGFAPGTATLSWKAPSDDTTLQYVVYLASIIGNVPTDLKAIIETWKTTATVKDLPAGTHKFYVVTRSKGAQSEPSEKVSITIRGEEPNTFGIIIDPLVQNISEGKLYTYQVKLQYPGSYKGGFAYKLEKAPAGMTISDNGKIEWANPVPGTYEIIVTSWMLEAPRSQAAKTFKIIVGTEKKNFEIKSKPKEIACLNKLYVYEAVATVPSDGGTVMWSLFEQIDGISIDEKSGRLTWTPTEVGSQRVKIKALFIKGNDTLVIYQSWTITVKENCDNVPAPPCSKFVGLLKDDNGNPILNGKVKFIRLEKDNLGPSSFETTVKNGQWMVFVRAGSYKIRFEGEGFVSEWFENVVEMGDAKVVIAECDKITDILGKVTLKEKPAMKVIEGIVKDSDGNPVPNSMVSFMIIERNGGSKDGGMRFAVKTNADGNYRIEVPAGMTYIAMATPNEALAKTHTHVYYDGKLNANDALRFTVNDGMTINFTLLKKAVYTNGLAVALKDTNGIGIKGRVTLIPVQKDKEPKKGMAITIETDSNGNALFSNLEPGMYIIQGIPNTRAYAPGFYTSSGFAAMSWKEAKRIEVGEVMITLVYDIRLRPLLGKRGAARVDGIIKGRGMMTKAESPFAEQELGGALLYALDENNDIADYAMSDNAGTYSMFDLGQDTYSIMADMVDFEPAFGTISTDYVNANTVNSSITMGSSALSVEEPSMILGEDVYPNPANAQITISGITMQGDVTIRIFSNTGMMISEFPVSINGNHITFPVNDLAIGAYMFRIVQNNSIMNGQFSIIR